MQKTNWHVQTVVDVAREWKTSLETGLASGVARKRLEAGRNVIAEAERPLPLSMLASQFTDTMVLVLLAATLLSGLLGDIIDAIVILTIVIINGILGFIQEYRAERSLEEIKKLSSPHATVVRDGKRQIAAEVGDMVEIEAGDRILIDMRLSITTSLRWRNPALLVIPAVRKTTDVCLIQTALETDPTWLYGYSSDPRRGRGW